MIKKIKLSLLVAVFSLVGVSLASAAAGDLTWSSNQTIDLSSPDTNLTIASGSTAESMVVGTGSITLSVASGDSFVISTESTGGFTVTPTTYVTKSCNSGVGTISITATGSETYTITPDTSTCNLSTGGGGGGTYVPPVVTPVVTPTIPVTSGTVDPGCSGGNKYNTSTGALCINNVGTTAHGQYNFGTKTLKNGSVGEAVKELQRFFNYKLNLGLVVDGKLGPKTIAVIKKWQKDNGLVADGLVGPKTKAMMNASVQ